MADTRTFKTYNFVTGNADGSVAYDFSNPGWQYQREERRRPEPRRETKTQLWIREDNHEAAEPERRAKHGLSPLACLGTLCLVILVVLMLLAQIQLLAVSTATAELEGQITTLREQQDKLRAEYETVFNIQEVEDYAINTLGMQEPIDSQIQYLSGVSVADKAVIITRDDTNMFARGMEDLVASVKAFLPAGLTGEAE